MNLHADYSDDGRRLDPAVRFDYLKDQGWSTLDILRLYQADARRTSQKGDTHHDDTTE